MKKKTAILLITAVVAIAAALAFTACSTTQVTFDLNGGTLDGSGENAVISASGKLDLSTVLPEKEDAEISGWTDEEGNFYGAYSVIEPVEGMDIYSTIDISGFLVRQPKHTDFQQSKFPPQQPYILICPPN